MFSERSAYTFFACLAAAGLFLILFVAGCFSAKITASHAAAILKSGEPTWKKVTCHRYTGGSYWNYTCVVVSRATNPFSFEVKVDGSGITDESAP